MTTKPQTPRYFGCEKGQMAPGARISVNTPLAPFQRRLNKTKVQEYINQHQGIDWNLFGYATAVRRPSGELLLINGQHRINAVLTILPEVKEVPAHVFDASDLEYAALMFSAMNGESSSQLKSEERFKSNCAAGQRDALELERVLGKTRFCIGEVNALPGHREIKFANFVKSVRFGEQCLLLAAELIDRHWPTGVVNDNLVSGISRFASIEAYSDLLDPKTKLRGHFDQWLGGLAALGCQQHELTFRRYFNAGPNYDAVAYGLARHFFKSLRSRRLSAPKLEFIEDIWKSHVRSSDTDSFFF
jgi:hypothetical protein